MCPAPAATRCQLILVLCFSDPKMIMNFSDPNGGVGSVLDSLKMSQQQLTPEQELKHQQQARKGIQTSPDGELGLSVSLKGQHFR